MERGNKKNGRGGCSGKKAAMGQESLEQHEVVRTEKKA